VIKDDDAVWKQDDYTPFGKWMDGWESRRRRTEGHDWAVIKLGLPGFIRAIEVDTAFFTGNFSPQVSIYGVRDPSSQDAVNQLVRLREESILSRPEFGRMGLKASEEEWELVQKLSSENWVEMVPLSPLGAGYEATRKTVFQIPSGLGPLGTLSVRIVSDQNKLLL
jgi:allantoicase